MFPGYAYTSMPVLHKIEWVAHNITVTVAPIVTLLYWLSIWSSGNFHLLNNGESHGDGYCGHTCTANKLLGMIFLVG